jgi:hypothetical protein
MKSTPGSQRLYMVGSLLPLAFLLVFMNSCTALFPVDD